MLVRNKVVSVNFSIAMDASTINSTTFGYKTSRKHSVRNSFVSGTTAKFVPATVLAANTTLYTATPIQE
jgi:hypothetical protein